MKEQNNNNVSLSRRDFLGGSAAALAALSVAPGSVLAGTAAQAVSKPNSVFNGVHIGTITYSYRGIDGSAEGTLAALLEDGLSEVELMGGPIQSYMSGESAGGGGGGRGGGAGGARGGQRGMQAVQRPNRRERLDAVDTFERQVATLRTQIQKAPSVDPNIANLRGDALTEFMNVYATESNTVNDISQTLSTITGTPVGGTGGIGGGLTEEALSELLELAKQDNAPKLAARLETLIKDAQAAAAARGGMGGRGGRGGGAAPVVELTPEQLQAQQAQRYVQLARCLDMRRMYNDAGVNIHLQKNSFGQSDEDIDFNFQIAKALGCVGITLERSEAQAERLAPFAEKHKIWIAFHNHTNNYPQLEPDDPILDYGNYIGFNFDTGHYHDGSGGLSPIPIIEKYHDRIVSLHLKDKTAGGGNLPWGEGTTPICEMLQLVAKEKWPIYADIELEYRVPQGSDSVAEVKKCVEYCRNCLI